MVEITNQQEKLEVWKIDGLVKSDDVNSDQLVKTQDDLNQYEKNNALNIDAKFEFLKDANMPNWINRYRIIKKSVDGNPVDWVDLMWSFFECSSWSVNLNFVNWSKLDDYNIWSNWNNKIALIMPLPFVSNWKTEWLTIVNWQKNSSEVMNYRWDNAIVWFKNGKSWILKVNVWSNSKTKTTESNPSITAFNGWEQNILNQILDPRNWYTVCQQMSIMDNGQKSCDFVWQSPSNQAEWWWRRYRFYVEMNSWKVWVVDFKEDITINQAIDIMRDNWIKNAVYADIIAYNVYFWDKNWQFYTRQEWSDWESSYEKITSTSATIPNLNSIVIEWK
jgi:hypothetical protein